MGAHMHFTTVRLHLLRADFSKALRMQTSGHPACKLNPMQPNLLHATSSNITPVANGHIAYQSDWIAVREYAVERAGARGIYAVVERPNSVAPDRAAEAVTLSNWCQRMGISDGSNQSR